MLVLALTPFITGSVKSGAWKITPQNDEFGDKTGSTALTILSQGSFSNTATTQGRLSVNVGILKNGIVIFRLWEYGKHPVWPCCQHKNIYYIRVKRTDGAKRIFRGTGVRDIAAIFLDNSPAFINYLKSAPGKSIKVYMQHHSSSYLFPITVRGFTRIYNRFKRRR